MRRKRLPTLTVALAFAGAQRTPAGEFDRLEGDALARIAGSGGAVARARLSVKEMEALPEVIKGERAAFLVVKTGQGNYARVLATRALRKAPDGTGEAAPVIVLERFDTFEPGRSGARRAGGAGLVLFDGFRVDLDTGQVVPEGQGGDLEFAAKGPGAPALLALGRASIVAPVTPPRTVAAATGPSAGPEVRPGDFAGRFRLSADGRWSGLLELEVGEDRLIKGRFRSDASGTVYPVSGEVAADPPHRARFTVKFPRTEQEYDAYLASGSKKALDGTFLMRGRTFGFHAVREGAAEGPGVGRD